MKKTLGYVAIGVLGYYFGYKEAENQLLKTLAKVMIKDETSKKEETEEEES